MVDFKKLREAKARLGRVDGFDQDKGADEGDEGREVLRRLLAAQGDAFEALDFADSLLDAGAALVEDLRKDAGFAAAFSR